jgi:hypothetical protein
MESYLYLYNINVTPNYYIVVCITTMSLRYSTIRSRPRKFGISFTVPDRVSSEINDKKRIIGKNPLRITRIPSGGPREYHNLIQEAEKGSSSILALKKKKNGVGKKLFSHKRAYLRSCFNDWHVQVFYFEARSECEQTTLNLTH